MAYADFRDAPTYFAVFKMMISSKNVNQNMLKIPYFLKKVVKIRQAHLNLNLTKLKLNLTKLKLKYLKV